MLSPEAVLVDRLAAWQFWGSTTDAVRACRDRFDRDRLDRLVEEREVAPAFDRLREFCGPFGRTEPTTEELREWAENGV